MKKFEIPAATQMVSWGATALLVITAVLPVLPEGTPPWVHTSLLILATILAVLTTRLGDTSKLAAAAKPALDVSVDADLVASDVKPSDSP